MVSADDVPEVLKRFPDPIVRYETSGGEPVVRWANDRAETLGEAAAAEGRPLADVLAGFDADADVDAVVGMDARASASMRMDSADRTFLVRRMATEEEDPARSGYLVFTDVTGHVGDDANAGGDPEPPSVEQIASVLSHDLRNPLEVAQIRLEAAHETGEDVHFEKVELALDRIEGLVRDVRTLARGNDIVGSTASVALDEIANDAWSTVRTGPATLEVDETATIEADADRLRQVLENAFRNSVEHAGPEVTVRIGLLGDGTGFYVADDGPGVPEEKRESVFEPGVSTRETGTGLGLTIMDRIADAHGWDVRIATADDGGARLEFDRVSIVD